MRWWAAVACAVVVAGCATEPPQPTGSGVFFPRHDGPLGAGDAALLEGRARFVDGCLWVVTDANERVLLLWPADTELGLLNSQPAVFGPARRLLFEVGDIADDVYGIGGSMTTAETARELVGEIPEPCARGSFWVVSDVVDGP
jgi:hypothetical protein